MNQLPELFFPEGIIGCIFRVIQKAQALMVNLDKTKGRIPGNQGDSFRYRVVKVVDIGRLG